MCPLSIIVHVVIITIIIIIIITMFTLTALLKKIQKIQKCCNPFLIVKMSVSSVHGKKAPISLFGGSW
jgi:hypothetical protein